MTAEPSPVRAAVTAGTRDAGLVVLGYIPFGLASGAAMAHTDVAPGISIASSFLVYAGAAQLAAIQLLGAGSGIAIVVATVLVVNARHLLYSASLEPHTRDWTRGQRLAGAFLLADPIFALAVTRFERSDERRARIGYYFAAGLTCYLGWGALVVAGVLLGGLIPPSVPLELAVPLTFLLLLVPLVRDRAGLVAAVVGGAVALIARPLPYGGGLLLGALAGIVVGALVLGPERPGRSDPDAPTTGAPTTDPSTTDAAGSGA
ncbi:AzlC family ABC transporter permease [Galbitalea sp. SE-J8]|uniref:AzlC family ABC transporter permease n=1 Tax=Galbitalea sp. SE-J8 TaxID=3054952 RepID=UPI00259CBF3E|nr:AzlC family ABC transporter permease [Galbitalea sp. SE-J8]MDM4763846.1 AzlC family ABC transporter permease [Galbitalea sp. SE-J8]